MKNALVFLVVALSMSAAQGSGELTFVNREESGYTETFKYISNSDDTLIRSKVEDDVAEPVYSKASDGSWSGNFNGLKVRTTPLRVKGEQISFSISFDVNDYGFSMIYDFEGYFNGHGDLQISIKGHDTDKSKAEVSGFLNFGTANGLTHQGTFKSKNSDYKVETVIGLKQRSPGNYNGFSMMSQAGSEYLSWDPLVTKCKGSLELKTLSQNDPILFALIFGIDWWVYLQQ